MQITGMLHGARLLEFAGFPTTEVLGPAASEEEIKAMLDKHGLIFIKPVFKGGIGKKGKAGLLGRATDAGGPQGRIAHDGFGKLHFGDDVGDREPST